MPYSVPQSSEEGLSSPADPFRLNESPGEPKEVCRRRASRLSRTRLPEAHLLGKDQKLKSERVLELQLPDRVQRFRRRPAAGTRRRGR
jgi:hypothetical protein